LLTLSWNTTLFYNCKIIFPVIQYIQTLIFEKNNVTFDEKSMILGYDKGTCTIIS
jgi:hypothetical protein